MESVQLQWERYLFDKHKLVALNPLESGVQLFSVLVKQRKEGRKPVLVKAGTLISLRSRDASEDWEEVVDKIQGFLDGTLNLRNKKVLAGIVEKDMKGNFNDITGQRSYVMMGLLNLLTVDGGRSKTLKIGMENIQTERIHSGLIDNLFTGDPPLWVPDLNKLAIEKQAPSQNGLTEIWVVVEVMYCTKLTVEPNVGSSGNAELNLDNQLTSIPVDIGCKMKVTNTTAGKMVVSGSNKIRIPLGFKTLRLSYDKSGKLQMKVSGGEEVRPIFRDDKSFDPNEYPNYHMGGLFVNDSEDLLECLTLCDNLCD